MGFHQCGRHSQGIVLIGGLGARELRSRVEYALRGRFDFLLLRVC